MMKETFPSNLNPRSARLMQEYEEIIEFIQDKKYISVEVIRRNNENIPNGYLITYNLKSITGVTAPTFETAVVKGEQVRLAVRKPIYGYGFGVIIDIPKDFPDGITGQPRIFMKDTVWHPNICFSGEIDMKQNIFCNNSIFDIILMHGEILSYRKYDAWYGYLSKNEEVAEWVRNEAEPMGWLPTDTDDYRLSSLFINIK